MHVMLQLCSCPNTSLMSGKFFLLHNSGICHKSLILNTILIDIGLAHSHGNQASRYRQQILLINTPLVKIHTIYLNNGNNLTIINNWCGQIRQIQLQTMIDKKMVILQHISDIGIFLSLTGMRQLSCFISQTHLLAEIVLVLAHNIYGNIIGSHNLAGNNCRLGKDILHLYCIQLLNNTV